MIEIIIAAIVALVIGGVAGFFGARSFGNNSIKNAEAELHAKMEEADRAAETLKREAIVEAKDES